MTRCLIVLHEEVWQVRKCWYWLKTIGSFTCFSFSLILLLPIKSLESQWKTNGVMQYIETSKVCQHDKGPHWNNCLSAKLFTVLCMITMQIKWKFSHSCLFLIPEWKKKPQLQLPAVCPCLTNWINVGALIRTIRLSEAEQAPGAPT